MKTIKFKVFFILTITALTFFSCNKDEPVVKLKPENFIRFTMDGTYYGFDSNVSTTAMGHTLIIRDGGIQSDDYISIGLFIPISADKGTHKVAGHNEGGKCMITLTSGSLNADFAFAESGSINVTGISEDYVAGYFTASFTLDDGRKVTITNGSFKSELN